MTKKYWTDWQKRIGETKNIYLFYKHYDSNNNFLWYDKKCTSGKLNELAGDKLIKAVFHGDAVDLVIEKWHKTFSSHIHVENEYITLHRKDIASIDFNKL